MERVHMIILLIFTFGKYKHIDIQTKTLVL